MNYRVGMGTDVHAVCEGSQIILGGVAIDSPFSLKGHSDADVLIHAIVDALLGAVADGDIGIHFPDNLAENKGRPSRDFLVFAEKKVAEKGYSISNIDATILCERPRISPYREMIIENLARILDMQQSQINIKATTTEKLGFAGRGEGVAAQAIVLVEKNDHLIS